MKIRQIGRTGYLLAAITALTLIPMITACGAKKAAPVLHSIGVTIVHSNIPILTMHSTMQLDATGNYSDGSTPDLSNDVIWASSNPSVASCKTGLLTGLGIGTTNITATLDDVTSQSLTITVTALSSVVVTPTFPMTLAIGASQQYQVSGINWDGSTADITSQVNWASDNPAAATISSTGLATAVGVGTTNITATVSGITSRAITLNVTATVTTAAKP
jgi:trimeric autotransporter adhesin